MQFKEHLIDKDISVKEVFYKYNMITGTFNREKKQLSNVYLFVHMISTGCPFKGAAVTRY